MNNTYIKNFLLWLFPSIISGSFLLQAFLTSPSTALTPAFLSHKKRTQRHLLNTNRFLVRNFKIENRVMASYSSFSSDDTSVVVDRLPVAISNKESSSISVITTTTATNSSTESLTTDILISDEKPLFQQLEEKSLRAALVSTNLHRLYMSCEKHTIVFHLILLFGIQFNFLKKNLECLGYFTENIQFQSLDCWASRLPLSRIGKHERRFSKMC